MTRLIVNGRAKPKSDIPHYPDHRHVVYLDKMGKTERGIHERKVTIDGKIAFVHPDEERTTADILPAMNVFLKKSDAERFFTQDGEERWVVYKPFREIPEIFKAKVKTVAYKRHGTWTTRIVMARVDGRTLDVRWDMVDYATEKEAYRHFKTTLAKDLKDARKRLNEDRRIMESLLKIQKKIEMFKIDRGYQRKPGIRAGRKRACRDAKRSTSGSKSSSSSSSAI